MSRDKELATLRDYLSTHVQQKTPGSLYISGPPGTGKTLCVSEVLGEEGVQSAKVVRVNCMSLTTSKAIFGRLGEELMGSKGKAVSIERDVEKFICSSKEMM